MTSRNLNQTWRDVVFNQYEQDHAADVPFPVRYLIHATEWKRDIFIEAPTKIDAPVFRRAVLDFVITRRFSDDPAYEDHRIKVRARVSQRPPIPPPAAPAQGDDDDVPSSSQDGPGQHGPGGTAGNGKSG